MGGYVGKTVTLYTPVDYLESSGTQFIDTGVYPNANIHCVVDFQLSSIPNSAQGIMGAWEGSKGMFFGVRPVNASTKNFQFAFGTSAWAGGTITADTNRHTLYMNDENGDGRLDNTMLASHSNVITLTDNNYTMYLFRANGSAAYYSYSKIYSCQVYNGSTLIRDYIPVLDENNVPCMYDKVGRQLYYNKGSGTFSYGTAGTPVEADVAKKIGEIYVGINNVARNVTKAYVGVNGVARQCFECYDYGDGSNNNVSNGYVNKIYLNGTATGSSGPTYFSGNYDLNPLLQDVATYSPIFAAINSAKDYNSIINVSSHLSWTSGTNTISINIDATNEAKTCMFDWRGNGRLGSACYYKGLKFKVGDTYYSLSEMVTNQIIKPLVLISSARAANSGLYTDVLKMYTAEQTDSKSYGNVTIAFMLNKGYILSNIQFYASVANNVSGISTTDGFGWAYCPISKARLTLN